MNYYFLSPGKGGIRYRKKNAEDKSGETKDGHSEHKKRENTEKVFPSMQHQCCRNFHTTSSFLCALCSEDSSSLHKFDRWNDFDSGRHRISNKAIVMSSMHDFLHLFPHPLAVHNNDGIDDNFCKAVFAVNILQRTSALLLYRNQRDVFFCLRRRGRWTSYRFPPMRQIGLRRPEARNPLNSAGSKHSAPALHPMRASLPVPASTLATYDK